MLEVPPERVRPRWRRIARFIGSHVVFIWLAVAAFLAAVFVIRGSTELERIGEALRAAEPRWLAIGVGIQATTLLATGLTYHLLLRRLGHRLSCVTLASAHLQRMAVGAISPVSGPTSVYVFLRLLAHRQVPAHDALLTVALRSAAGHGALVVTLFAALAFAGSLSMLAAAIGLVAMTAFGATRLRRRPAFLGRSWRFCLRRLPGQAQRWAVDFRTRLEGHRLNPRDLTWPLVLAVGTRVGAVALLFAMLRALGVEAPIGTAIAVYLVSVLAFLTVPVFGGAGVVEGATAVALHQTGLAMDLAVGVALLWRLIDFWLPIGVGLLVHVETITRPAVSRYAERLAIDSTRSLAGLVGRAAPVARPQPVPVRTGAPWPHLDPVDVLDGGGPGSGRQGGLG